ncbi:MAG: hypothetical protein LBT59_26215 [Clostridiales bacterium]|jgi:hypothetical protein|nr:hypothetical protein [Clostridiales bacterium]
MIDLRAKGDTSDMTLILTNLVKGSVERITQVINSYDFDCDPIETTYSAVISNVSPTCSDKIKLQIFEANHLEGDFRSVSDKEYKQHLLKSLKESGYTTGSSTKLSQVASNCITQGSVKRNTFLSICPSIKMPLEKARGALMYTRGERDFDASDIQESCFYYSLKEQLSNKETVRLLQEGKNAPILFGEPFPNCFEAKKSLINIGDESALIRHCGRLKASHIEDPSCKEIVRLIGLAKKKVSKREKVEVESVTDTLLENQLCAGKHGGSQGNIIKTSASCFSGVLGTGDLSRQRLGALKTGTCAPTRDEIVKLNFFLYEDESCPEGCDSCTHKDCELAEVRAENLILNTNSCLRICNMGILCADCALDFFILLCAHFECPWETYFEVMSWSYTLKNA